MSPLVEGIRHNEGDPYFQVRLDEPNLFDVILFDEQYKEVSDRSRDRRLATYVVGNNTLYVCPNRWPHMDCVKNLYLTNLESAGVIEYYTGKVDGAYQRDIYGCSNALAELGLLSRRKSDKYRMTVMQKALGDYFNILPL